MRNIWRKVVAMFNTKSYSTQIQANAMTIFKCDERGIGGLADLNQIERDPFYTILFIMGNYYNKLEGKSKKKIDLFVGTYSDQFGKSIEEIGEFDMKLITSELNEIISTI